MNAPEIVTLQLGHYSNFVGSHWWNCQESSFVYDPKVAAANPKEVNHDVLYREGQTVKGEVTYTPRLLLFDLNNSLGTMKREGILYDVAGEEHVQWQGDVTLHETAIADKNPFLLDLEKEYHQNEAVEERETNSKSLDDRAEEINSNENDSKKTNKSHDIQGQDGDNARPFYQLDNDVTVWSDFLRTSLHSKSVNIIKEYQHNNPEQPFDVFGMGEQLLSKRESLDALEDRVRYFTEECDHLQGFHILSDSHNAFGGLANPILNYLSEEYPNKCRFSFSVCPATPPDSTARERSCRIINSALSLQSLTSYTSLHLPLSLASSLWRNVGPPIAFPHLHYQANLDYHTSAILASALDTLSMPYRKLENPFKMADVTSALSPYGRKIASLSASIPLPLTGHDSLADYLIKLEGRDPWISLTPNMTSSAPWPDLQSVVVRGLPKNQVFCPRKSQPTNQLALCSSVDEVLRLYLSEAFPRTGSAGCVMRDPIKLDTSFPHIFQDNVGQNGFLTDTSRPPFRGVEGVPLMTSLQCGENTRGYIQSLTDSVSRLNIDKHQHFLEAGLDPDDFTETLQALKDLGHCYSSS